MKELYVVLFEGKVRERESKREVKSRLMDCFNMGQAAIDRLFSGQRVIVFRSEDRAKTDDFAKRFAETGALCRIEVDFREEAEKEPPLESSQQPEEEHRAEDVHWEDDGAASSLDASPLLPLWQSFAGPRGEWYAEKFKLFSKDGRTAFAPSWNWGAFLFGIVWLIYRKMYGLAILFFGISAAGIVIPGGSLAVSFFFGAFANFLYFLHVKKKVDAIISASDQIDPNLAMERIGGVNPIPKVLAIFLIMMGVMAFIGTYLFDLSELTPHLQ
ncbi:DUF2628 domain-containing protein [Desulfoluna butyratoxydans]|uniref:DUF2628 domain-containing protein n=1 Tax=Desulfoluna butyratoxydans TaxID=231438 RepID=A0A4U8YRN6_9BACT|nr:DUF2628 domain-containing protein [Desulfoluna butyratoxydans]VFQ46530.1 protein of unknown function duf2628 [Desulfoluna butyratoxydans]